MKNTVKGKFEIKAVPLAADEALLELGAMRMNFEKRFEGKLEATSLVAMIGVMDQELGSGGYVALEKVTGRLDGHEGTFCFQHSCTMARGKPSQHIVVIPDSGTGELAGISGSLTIDIAENGDHFYAFEYELGAGRA